MSKTDNQQTDSAIEAKGSSRRPIGTAAMDLATRTAVARAGGTAVSRNRAHMAAIGRKGGTAHSREHMSKIGKIGRATPRVNEFSPTAKPNTRSPS